MNREYKPHIFENTQGEFVLVYGEEIIDTYTSLKKAIEKAGNEFIYTASQRP